MNYPPPQIELPYTEAELRYYQRKYPQLKIDQRADREILRRKVRWGRALDGRINPTETGIRPSVGEQT